MILQAQKHRPSWAEDNSSEGWDGGKPRACAGPGFAPSAPRKGSTSKPLLHSQTIPAAGREAKWGQAGKQDWGNATQQGEDIICSELPPQLNLTVLPGWTGFYTAVKSNKSFLWLWWALACNHHFSFLQPSFSRHQATGRTQTVDMVGLCCDG